MYYVYLICSTLSPDQKYVGFTEDLQQRLKAHNAGQSRHTSKFVPWKLVGYHAFESKEKALAFEKYLKSGSGQAFAAKHFW